MELAAHSPPHLAPLFAGSRVSPKSDLEGDWKPWLALSPSWDLGGRLAEPSRRLTRFCRAAAQSQAEEQAARCCCCRLGAHGRCSLRAPRAHPLAGPRISGGTTNTPWVASLLRAPPGCLLFHFRLEGSGSELVCVSGRSHLQLLSALSRHLCSPSPQTISRLDYVAATLSSPQPNVRGD